jgi:hypothetical protein
VDSAVKTARGTGRKPFFGEWPPGLAPLLVFLLGLASVTVFYATVFASAHAVAAESGATPDQLAMVSVAVCALFLLQGLVPIVRFSIKDLPRLAVTGFKVNVRDAAMFVLLVVAGAFLLFG